MKNLFIKLKSFCRREQLILTGKISPTESDYCRAAKICWFWSALNVPIVLLIWVKFYSWHLFYIAPSGSADPIIPLFIVFMIMLPVYLFYSAHFPND